MDGSDVHPSDAPIIYLSVCIYLCLSLSIYIYIYVYIHIYIYIYYVLYVYIYIHTHIDICICTLSGTSACSLCPLRHPPDDALNSGEAKWVPSKMDPSTQILAKRLNGSLIILEQQLQELVRAISPAAGGGAAGRGGPIPVTVSSHKFNLHKLEMRVSNPIIVIKMPFESSHLPVPGPILTDWTFESWPQRHRSPVRGRRAAQKGKLPSASDAVHRMCTE